MNNKGSNKDIAENIKKTVAVPAAKPDHQTRSQARYAYLAEARYQSPIKSNNDVNFHHYY